MISKAVFVVTVIVPYNLPLYIRCNSNIYVPKLLLSSCLQMCKVLFDCYRMCTHTLKSLFSPSSYSAFLPPKFLRPMVGKLVVLQLSSRHVINGAECITCEISVCSMMMSVGMMMNGVSKKSEEKLASGFAAFCPSVILALHRRDRKPKSDERKKIEFYH